MVTGTDLEPLPAKGEAAEWELWQATQLFSQDSAAEEAAAAAAAEAAPVQQDQQQAQSPSAPQGDPQMSGPDGESRTGGDTGLEWGTGGVWTEPFDVAAARDTLDRIARHWHRQDLGSSSSGGHRQPEAGAASAHLLHDSAAEPHARDELNSLQSDVKQADAWDDPGGGANAVCTHAACSVQVMRCECTSHGHVDSCCL